VVNGNHRVDSSPVKWRPQAPGLPDEVIDRIVSLVERDTMTSAQDGSPTGLDGKPIAGLRATEGAERRPRILAQEWCDLFAAFARTYQHGHDPSDQHAGLFEGAR